jgi:hypothetical protein
LRLQLREVHSDAVDYASETAHSYVEAIFRAGERQYVTVSMLCQHGVLFEYISDLHPTQIEKLVDPWKWSNIPTVDEIAWQPNNSAIGLCSPKVLLARIYSQIQALPDIDPDHALPYLEKEIARAAVSIVPTDRSTENAGERGARTVKHKRSTEPGEAKAKIIAALTAHHQYDNGSCGKLAPIGGNELARVAKVSQGKVSGFFKEQFGSHSKYKVACHDTGTLAQSLRMLNGELKPSILLNPIRGELEAAN